MRFLLDEMFPPQAASILRIQHGHGAVHVFEVGLQATDDATVAAFARADQRTLVAENVVDYAIERDIVLVFVLKRNLLRAGGQAPAVAALLTRWADANPDPYVGHHWPH